MKPAANKSTTHQCQRSTGNTPHVGGAVITCSNNVFIENLPALRKGDILQCNAPDMPKVNSGSSRVFINDKAAARTGDTTNHQSGLVGGASKVFIGG